MNIGSPQVAVIYCISVREPEKRRKTMPQEIRTKVAKVGMGLVLALLASSATPAQDVTTNSMPGTNFAQNHTYKWVPIEGASHPNQIVDAQINSSIDSQLAGKGLMKTDGEKADLLIGYQVSVDHEKQWNAYSMGGPRMGGMGSATSSTISVGTLVLDMYDPTTKQLVWTGRATKTLDLSNSQEKKQKNLDKAMQKLLKNYPPK
jgi:uncharacterized protein DUF4136